MLAQTLTTQKSNIWSVKPDSIFAFSNDQAVLNFTRHYLVNYALKHDSKVDPIAKFENCAKCSSPSNQQLFKSAKKICLCMDSIAEEKLFIQLLSIITYECVIHDTLQALPIWVTYLKVISNVLLYYFK